MELASEIIKYRKSLSQRIFSKLQDLKGKLADMMRFCESFRVGWKEWKKNDKEKEESSLRFSRSPRTLSHCQTILFVSMETSETTHDLL